MAIYDVPDELSLLVVEQQFPGKFITANPGEYTAAVLCVRPAVAPLAGQGGRQRVGGCLVDDG